MITFITYTLVVVFGITVAFCWFLGCYEKKKKI